jgi:hypothetical protein
MKLPKLPQQFRPLLMWEHPLKREVIVPSITAYTVPVLLFASP